MLLLNLFGMDKNDHSSFGMPGSPLLEIGMIFPLNEALGQCNQKNIVDGIILPNDPKF